MAEKILPSKNAREGERKQVMVLFADLKGSMALLADRDSEDARQLLDPVLERLIVAVHCDEGAVNQVLGDGMMALFDAPIILKAQAMRVCSAVVRMPEAVGRSAEGLGMRSLQPHGHRGRGPGYSTIGQREQARTAASSAIDRFRFMAMPCWLSPVQSALAPLVEPGYARRALPTPAKGMSSARDGFIRRALGYPRCRGGGRA